jgi:hypothetical protein
MIGKRKVYLVDGEQILINWRKDVAEAEEDYSDERIVLLARPYSMHPDDHYLSIVMAQLPNNTVTPYVTWGCNVSFGEIRYFEGHYFKTKEEAFEDWKTR